MAADHLTEQAFRIADAAGAEVRAVVTQGRRVVVQLADHEHLEVLAFDHPGTPISIGEATSTLELAVDGGSVRFWSHRVPCWCLPGAPKHVCGQGGYAP